MTVGQFVARTRIAGSPACTLSHKRPIRLTHLSAAANLPNVSAMLLTAQLALPSELSLPLAKD
jgi:hypothetical protein